MNFMSIKVGNIVEGVVSGITDFGAFIDLGEGRTGLVHISEVASDYVKDIKNYLKKGQKVKVKVLSVDSNKKISLSIKQAELPKKKSYKPAEIQWGAEKNDSGNFEDKMSQFLKDSEERMQALNTKSSKGSGRKSGNSRGN